MNRIRFVLFSGHEGTSYFADRFAQHISPCCSTHKINCAIGNPTLFFKPDEWNTQPNDYAVIPMPESHNKINSLILI